ncbi:MAG: HlyD family secretion protein [Rhodothermales bacterium]|jgi:HlyD family secretion protein
MSSSNLLDLHSADPSRPVPKPRIRWWSRVLIPAIVILGVALLLLAATWRNFVPAQSVRVEPAIAKQIGERAPASAVVLAAGWLEAFPYQTHVTALADGVAKDILVLEGDAVEAGQVVAELDAADAELALRKARAELAAHKAAQQKATAGLEAARQSWEHPVALEQAKASTAAGVREQQSMLAEVEARIAEQTAVMNQARRDAERAKGMVKDDVVSAQTGEKADAELEAAAAALLALQRGLAAASERLERLSVDHAAAGQNLELRIEDRQAVDESKADLSQAEAAVVLAEANTAEAELRLARMTIRSPIDGIVVIRHKEPGDKVMRHMDHSRSASIVSLYDPTKLQARVDVPLADAGQIRVGQDCEITTDVMPNRSFVGKVVRVLHQADIQKNTLQAKVVIANPTPELRPEMLCRVRFLAESADNSEKTTRMRSFVPQRAIANGQIWLAQMTNDSFATVKPHAATDDLELDGWRAVEGIRPGALVVVDPPADLQVGQRVRVVKDEGRP